MNVNENTRRTGLRAAVILAVLAALLATVTLLLFPGADTAALAGLAWLAAAGLAVVTREARR